MKKTDDSDKNHRDKQKIEAGNKKGGILSPFKALKFLFQKPVTIRTPFEHHETPPRYRGFHINDLDKCIGCGSCARICDNEAIRMVDLKGKVEEKEDATTLRPVIDYGRCCWCALCVDICPSGSLSMTQEYTHISNDLNSFLMLPDKKGIHKKDYPEGYHRDEDVNFVEPKRIEMPEVEAKERISSFIEIVRGYSREQAKREAERCLGCGICKQVCPAHMDIPEYIAAIWDDNIEESIRQIYKTNPLASICGRVCTHKCESVCALNHKGEPVAIRWLKRYALDNIPIDKLRGIAGAGIIKKANKKVAIIGAGPAGLSCAYYLSLMGYEITIYEMMPQAGGTMRYGIPEYRLPYTALDKDISTIESIGVKFFYNTRIGRDIRLERLRANFDAVFSAIGLSAGRSTHIEGTDLDGVYRAIDLLRGFTLREPLPLEKKIIVIGGGNVAMDIARTMARLQKQKYGKVDIVVTSLESREIMPADEEEITGAEEEGIRFFPARGPKLIIKTDHGLCLDTIKCTRVFDGNKRFNPLFNEEDKVSFTADIIIEAIGQAPLEGWLDKDSKEKLKYTGRRIKINEYYQTSLEWLFVGGDIVKGPDVISAIDSGHKAAKGIDTYLNN